MALTPPAMTPAEIAASPLFAPPVRVTCYPCGTSLFVGDEVPDGGGDAVFKAAGCAKGTCPGKNPAGYPAPEPAAELAAITTVGAPLVVTPDATVTAVPAVPVTAASPALG